MIHNLVSMAMKAEYINDHLQDTPDLLRYMETIRSGAHVPPPNCHPVSDRSLAFSLDVVAMYTNINWEKGARAAGRLWERWRSSNQPDHPFKGEHIFNTMMFILSHAYFTFGTKASQQIFGTIIGNSSAVVFANAYMGEFFNEFCLGNQEYVTEIPFRKRFLDHIFGFANMTLETFQVFVNQINNWSKSAGWGIELTVSGVGTSVPYLDTEVYLSNGEWHTFLEGNERPCIPPPEFLPSFAYCAQHTLHGCLPH